MSTPRILMVAPERDGESLSRMLQSQGYEVTGLSGPAEEVEAMAQAVQPDLVLISVTESEGDNAIEVAALLREALTAPVVYVVEEWTEESWPRALGAEPAGYTVKPVRPWDLQATVELALRRHHAEVRLRNEGEHYRILFHQNVAGVYQKSADGTLLQCNLSFARIFGYDGPEELEGQPMEILYTSQEDRAAFLKRLRDRGSVTNYELPMRRKDGAPIWVLENAALAREPEGEPPVVIGTLIDITDRKTLEIRLERQANQDPLTGLANRRALEARAEQTLEMAVRRDEVGALLFLDLIQFKVINDTLGHRAGDEVLVETAARIEDALRASDTAARVGGDEFVALLPDVGDEEGACTAGRRILDGFRPPMTVAGESVDVRVRIGAALFPEHARDLSELMALAGRVVSDLKGRSESSMVFYAPE